MRASRSNTDPRVFATIVIFDKNYKFLDVAYQQLTSSGVMNASYTVKEAGYAFLYVSNEQQNQTDVYFDDVTMTYTPSSIIQSSEYYPFGLQAANSWTRDNTTANNFLYDAGNELNTTSGFYDLPFRNYDAALGRFFQVDPLSTKAHDFTPYHYGNNNPIRFNDPSGLMTQAEFAGIIRRLSNGDGGSWSADGGYNFYTSADEAFEQTIAFLNSNGGWAGTAYGSEAISRSVYNAIKESSSSGKRQLAVTGRYKSESGGAILGDSYFALEVDGKGNAYIPYTNELFTSQNNPESGGSWFDKHYFIEMEGDISLGPQATFTYVPYVGVVSVPYSNTGGAAVTARIMAITLWGMKVNNREGATYTNFFDKKVKQGLGISLDGAISVEYEREMTNGRDVQNKIKGSTLNGLLGIEINFTTGDIFVGSMFTGSWTMGIGVSGGLKYGFMFNYLKK